MRIIIRIGLALLTAAVLWMRVQEFRTGGASRNRTDTCAARAQP